jgi:hypothetical protein
MNPAHGKMDIVAILLLGHLTKIIVVMAIKNRSVGHFDTASDFLIIQAANVFYFDFSKNSF